MNILACSMFIEVKGTEQILKKYLVGPCDFLKVKTLQHAAKFDDFFGLDFNKIYLIGSIVPFSKNLKKALNHSITQQ